MARPTHAFTKRNLLTALETQGAQMLEKVRTTDPVKRLVYAVYVERFWGMCEFVDAVLDDDKATQELRLTFIDLLDRETSEYNSEIIAATQRQESP